MINLVPRVPGNEVDLRSVLGSKNAVKFSIKNTSTYFQKCIACCLTAKITETRQRVGITVREIAKTVYIKSCDMIGRAKTKTNHIDREGLKMSEIFVGKKGSHIAMRHLGNNTRKV